MNEELMSCRLQLVEGLRLKSLLDDDFFDRMFWIKNFRSSCDRRLPLNAR